ncbi:MAG: tyrosine-type recombinase/integrase [Candidatus Bathyarchaeota archaeon]|nr:tyrosine-type recombinase/integrase [Candidatus Bathyarchaeota archaeon]
MVEAAAVLRCPECGSVKLFRAGLRYLADGGSVQRYLCRSCGYRFSGGHNNSNRVFRENRNCQILRLEAKNLDSATETKTVAGAEQTVKGKLVEFAWKLQNQGFRTATIKTYSTLLKRLAMLGADLLNPESVKETVAKNQNWNENTKLLAVTAYQCFLDLVLDKKWRIPNYTRQEKIAYVPTTEDVDALIAGSGKKLATFLTLLKETGCRCGEAIRLEWTDIDFQRRVVRIQAEKNSKPRILPISTQLTAMIETLPKKSKKVFSGNLASMHNNLQVTRIRQAQKLGNPQLLKISFHALRHLKGTTEYHKTHDLLHVQNLLGHKSVKSTMIYINLEAALYHNNNMDEFHVKVAETLEDACKLLEAGFEYVTDMEGKKLFRKRK